MKKQLFLKSMLLLCALIVGSGSVWATTSTYGYTFSAKPSTGTNISLGGINWDISATKLGSYNNGYAGVQIGDSSNSGSITLTSSNAWGAQTSTSYTGKTIITEIRLWLNNGSGSVSTKSVTIGGKAASASGTVGKNTSANGDYTKASQVTYTPAANGKSGIIVINIATSSKAAYVCRMEIDCEEPAVIVPVSSVSINKAATTIAVGEKETLTSTVLPADATNKSVTWSSSDGDVATVANGVVTAVAEGTATITLTSDADGTKTATCAITVVNSPVAWEATAITDLTANDVFVIVGKKTSTYYALPNDKGTSTAPDAPTVAISGSDITSTITDRLKWNISGNADDGYTFYPNGTTATWLYCTNTNDGVRVGTNANKTFIISDGYLKHEGTNRYVGVYTSNPDWRCYTSTSTNIDGQTFAFYRGKVDVTLATSGYATYCCPVPLNLTPGDGYAAWAVTSVSGTTVTFTKITGNVPAGTPFILYGEEKGGQTVSLTPANGSTTAVDGNMLAGTLVATDITTVTGDYTNFGLSGGQFVKINDGTIPANKAYLPILTDNLPTAHSLDIVFEDGNATGITNVERRKFNAETYYNLAGQRVDASQKGIVIVNGKKYFNK